MGSRGRRPRNFRTSWLQEARNGSQEALGQALEACRAYLLMVANHELDAQLRGKVAPSDLVQETFVDAQRNFAAFHGTSEAELLAWLRRILLNNVVEAVRHYREAGKRSLASEVSISAAPRDELLKAVASEVDSPSDQALTREQDTALREALGKLPEQARRVIDWRNYERCSFEEIGRRLSRTAEAARKLWARALVELKKHLDSPEAS